MDDSVIKVLRRNGSWSKNKSTLGQDNMVYANKKAEEEFSLDKNFGILAEEIKKRMKLKKENNNTNIKEDSKKDLSINAKKELLPLLKNVEVLTNQRDDYSKKITLIDESLEKVKNEIVNIRETYERNIDELQSNINFFDQSIALINKIKGDN
tara:strand:- start:229 stop:687 length:459 start_codon:yes stop_codon:yes gene_type:complete